MRDHPIGCPALSNQPRQRPRIHPRNPNPAIRTHPRIKMLSAAEIRWVRHILPHNRTESMGVLRLHILHIRADIADMGKGEIDDLARKARVGHDLLITGHGGVEAYFAYRVALCTKSPAPNDFAGCQNQYSSRTRGRARRGRVGHNGVAPAGCCDDVVKRQPIRRRSGMVNEKSVNDRGSPDPTSNPPRTPRLRANQCYSRGGAESAERSRCRGDALVGYG